MKSFVNVGIVICLFFFNNCKKENNVSSEIEPCKRLEYKNNRIYITANSKVESIEYKNIVYNSYGSVAGFHYEVTCSDKNEKYLGRVYNIGFDTETSTATYEFEINGVVCNSQKEQIEKVYGYAFADTVLELTPTSAVLHGLLFNSNIADSVLFRYAAFTDSLWTYKLASFEINDYRQVDISIPISGLKPLTKYEYEILVFSKQTHTISNPFAFKTLSE